MTPEAKGGLATSIRDLRERLLADLHAATEAAYRFSVRTRDAGLSEAARARRARFETWINEQVRAQEAMKGKSKRSEEDFRWEAEKQAAYTLLNRLVLLRLMEESAESGKPLRSPTVVKGGWESSGYRDFRELAPALVRGDETEGYGYLLRLIFEDLAIDLPGLYGAGGIAELVPIPAATLRRVVDVLNAPALETCWSDNMTLGWVYQYWNDPDREALDAKLHAGGKLEPYEIASKTQMFTERYMVDWLLQNSLGPMWLAMCRKHGWTPEVESAGILAALEARRVEWRRRRESGEVELAALMPLHSDVEQRWAYYIPQPIPDDAVEHAPESVREIKLLDPAVGSGHFLVVALDLLVALYREESRHREEAASEQWADRAIVERILSHNLHGIDLDPRAVQIAAAALWLRARQIAPDAHPERLNLVASNLRLASLADEDPAIVELRGEVERETGIPSTLTDALVHALRGADHLGSLLKIDHVVEEALDDHERGIRWNQSQQAELFTYQSVTLVRGSLGRARTRATLLDLLEAFLSKHTGGDDLGLRLRGEQLAAGVRFVRMLRGDTYDLIVANPPYQGTSKMTDSRYIENLYPLGKADLYAAFLLRGLELVRSGGVSSMLTMRSWMFIKQFADLRRHVLASFDLRALGDFAVGAFDEVPNDLLSVTVSVIRRTTTASMDASVAQQPTPPTESSYDRARTQRKRAATLCHVGVNTFRRSELSIVPEWPMVYWWGQDRLSLYRKFKTLGDLGGALQGISTANNDRFLRAVWECSKSDIWLSRGPVSRRTVPRLWVPYVKGPAGTEWIEPARHILNWKSYGLDIRLSRGAAWRNDHGLFKLGVSFPRVGSSFSARAHRYASAFDAEGPTFITRSPAEMVCMLNAQETRELMAGLNPTIHFTQGDVARLPAVPIDSAESIFKCIESAFDVHESHREQSIEFLRPGPSAWRSVQTWARGAVDRAKGAPVPPYREVRDPEPPSAHMSFYMGVALGRFRGGDGGVVDPVMSDVSAALPNGILFLDTTLDDSDLTDGLGLSAAREMGSAWERLKSKLGSGKSLRQWLATDFFREVHRTMYENRPIYWPLSSQQKVFVAWVGVHRAGEQTLRVLLADHLAPALTRLDGELNDLRAARDSADKRAARLAERVYDRKVKARDELKQFMADVEQCADRGAPQTDTKCEPREKDARYAPDLDDGVMINSAALWPLLEPQWKDPKKWWREISNAEGRKDYDWSHLAMRYWPKRVDEKCRKDPSLAVAHGCFWRYHPGRAWAWELRFQEEIGGDFRIIETPYRPGGKDVGDIGEAAHREAWLCDHAEEALAAIETEALRRMGRGKKRTVITEMRILETGLWTAHPEEMWRMELRLAEKQGKEIRILAPDEAHSRARFESEHPERIGERRRFFESLAPPVDWLEQEEEAGEEAGDGELAEAETDEDGN